MISVISFDVGCTLFWEKGCVEGWLNYSLKRISRALSRELRNEGYDVDDKKVYSIFYDIAKHQLINSPDREQWSLYKVYLLLSRLGIKPSHYLVNKLYEAYINDVVNDLVFEEKYRDLLIYLKSRGYTIVLSTDTSSHEIPLRLIYKANISKYVDVIISSQLLGYTKASRLFFENLVELVGVNPSNILHVGDSVERDYLVPAQLGIKTVLYRKLGCSKNDPKPCINDLYEIRKYI